MDKEIKDKEDVIETQNEGEKDKEDVIEDEVKDDQRTDDDIKAQLDRLFDAVDGITKDVAGIKDTVAGFVDYGGVVQEPAIIEAESPVNDNKKFTPIEDLDLSL